MEYREKYCYKDQCMLFIKSNWRLKAPSADLSNQLPFQLYQTRPHPRAEEAEDPRLPAAARRGPGGDAEVVAIRI